MPVVVSPDQPARLRGLVFWRVLVWLLLLVSAFGCVQYLQHAQRVWGQLQAQASLEPSAVDALHGMLGWDAGYLLVAFVLIIICAGCILRQGWARPCLRVAAVIIAVWLLITGFLLLRDLQMLGTSSAGILAQAQQQGAVATEQIMARLQRSYQLALAFKTIGAIALLWLSWKLGKPGVRAQFRTRR
jgi:hypothetical protein